jgi:hypothetical protein
MARALGFLAALLAILVWTFGNTIVELESYRQANSSGMCHVAGVDYAADAQARAQREECLSRTTTSNTVLHLLHALGIR